MSDFLRLDVPETDTSAGSSSDAEDDDDDAEEVEEGWSDLDPDDNPQAVEG